MKYQNYFIIQKKEIYILLCVEATATLANPVWQVISEEYADGAILTACPFSLLSSLSLSLSLNYCH